MPSFNDCTKVFVPRIIKFLKSLELNTLAFNASDKYHVNNLNYKLTTHISTRKIYFHLIHMKHLQNNINMIPASAMEYPIFVLTSPQTVTKYANTFTGWTGQL